MPEDKAKGAKEPSKKDEMTSVVSPEAKKKKMILLAAIGGGTFFLILIVIIVVVLLKPKHQAESSEGGEHQEEKKEHKEEKHEDIVIDSSQAASFLAIEPAFVVNVGGGSGRLRMLQIKVQLMSRNQKVIDIAVANMPLLQNALVKLFSSKTYDELSTIEGRESLRVESLKAVQDIMKKEIGQTGIEEVLFTSFVMQ